MYLCELTISWWVSRFEICFKIVTISKTPSSFYNLLEEQYCQLPVIINVLQSLYNNKSIIDLTNLKEKTLTLIYKMLFNSWRLSCFGCLNWSSREETLYQLKTSRSRKSTIFWMLAKPWNPLPKAVRQC